MTFDELRSKAETVLNDEDCVTLTNNLKDSKELKELIDTFLVEALVEGLAEQRLAMLLASAYYAGKEDGYEGGVFRVNKNS